ncbi:aldo/keto reductase [Ottowia sp.]|uniref:aldo/keto reductase n=1 Tax=Ottowia sp. TaxID=1898956 RepID=UPI002C31BC0C|nr:aldo/keto reductase [Ottowia sp.]
MSNEHQEPGQQDPAARGRRNFLAGTLGAATTAALAVGAQGAAQAQPAAPAVAAGGGQRPRRRLGPLEVSPIGLGCMAMAPGFYNPAPERQAMVRLIRDAHRMGVTFFDTAEVYGPFISEEIVGEALAPIRNEVVLASKFGFGYNGSSVTGRNSQLAHIKARVEGMLKRLRTDRIDLLYLHRMDPSVPIADIAGAVGDLIKAGKVRAFGVSEVNPETLRDAHAVTPVAAVQSEYSLLERLPEVAMLDTCAELGIGFVPWGPTMRGLLADGFNAYSRFATQDRRASVPFLAPEALETNLKIVALAREWAQRKNATPVQIALAWLLAQRDFIVPIPGTTKWPHLRENMGAVDVRFTAEELAEFRTALAALPMVGNRPASKARDNE